jgi:hypothetical protein
MRRRITVRGKVSRSHLLPLDKGGRMMKLSLPYLLPLWKGEEYDEGEEERG